MKNTSSIALVGIVKAVIVLACLSLTIFQTLQAQSVDVLNSLSNNTETSAPDVDLLTSQPSRFAVGNAGLYASAHMANFYMNDKKMDIFGLFQDPNAKPIINTSTTTKKGPGPGHFKAKPLAEVIQGIKVSTIMIKEKRFLVGDVSYREAEEFSLTTQEGRSKQIKVMKVEPEFITFKDLDTDEEATLKINALPPGMESGSEKFKPAGMSSSTEKKHINLQNK